MERKYFKPKSLTWLAGAVPVALGLFVATEPLHTQAVWVQVVNDMTGHVGPYTLINGGLALIGIRGAL